MGRRKSANRAENDQGEFERFLASLFDLITAEDHGRKCLALGLKRLINTLQSNSISSPEDEWLLRVEQSAAQVREECKQFQDDSARLREEVYCLLRSLEDSSRLSPSNENKSFDPVRIVLTCRSFMASYRLQAQMDEQIVDEVLSFLSTLYVNIYFTTDSGEMNGGGTERSNIVTRINRWIEHIENQVFLGSTPWQDALYELQRSCRSQDTSKKHYHAVDELETEKLCEKQTLNKGDRVPLMNPVVDSDSIMEAVNCFLGAPELGQTSSLSFLVIVGSQGSGKTFLCDTIERKAQDNEGSVQVLRPTLPIDLMGASLGETEDTIASIFGLAYQSKKCILLLDDIDRMLGQQETEATSAVGGGSLQSDTLPHSQTRLVSSFLSHIDSLRTTESVGNHQLLIIGTASNHGVESIGRIDKVFLLDPPNDIERREIISCSLCLSTNVDSENAMLLTDLVDCTVGRSRSELVQYCRQTISSYSLMSESATADRPESAQEFSNRDILLTMKALLQAHAPESLRTGAVSDFVDMTVLTARDLNAPNDSASGEPELPLFGNDARQSWEEMKSLIVMPLCQANALGKLMYGTGVGGGKTVCGGVLLVGLPGCGKSALAYHCASVAARLVPSVTLLDVSCTSLVHKEVGGSERALRHLFASAQAAAPCILLMDGIENIAAVRGNDNTTEGTMDRILSTLLIELDGVETQSDGAGKIAVIGITHNEQWIDSALRRPGRLERAIMLHKPDYDARYQMVLKELHSLSANTSTPSASEYDMELASFVADHTDGMSGAEVLALCSEARMESARKCIQQNKELEELDRSITREHFIAAGLRQ